MHPQPRQSLAIALFLPAALALGACATSSAPAGGKGPDTAVRAAEAATAPLGDLNLVRTEIPAVLQSARKSAYAQPTHLDCAELTKQVVELDTALGADLDTAPTESNPGLIERGRGEIENSAIGALRNSTEGILPFRGWIRTLSGADQHAREVAAGIAAGVVRRAYLKGLGQGAGCAAPAAPLRTAAP